MFERQQKLLGKFTAYGSQPTPESFPELPECLIWMRFFLAVNYGYYMGNSTLDNSRGITPMLMALNFIGFAPMVYCMIALKTDSDVWGGKLLMAGLPNALALVMLIWIYFYTLEHSSEEEKLEGLLAMVKANKPVDSGDGDLTGGEGQEAAAEVPPPMEESEF